MEEQQYLSLPGALNEVGNDTMTLDWWAKNRQDCDHFDDGMEFVSLRQLAQA
jgi:hypothetical protein